MRLLGRKNSTPIQKRRALKQALSLNLHRFVAEESAMSKQQAIYATTQFHKSLINFLGRDSRPWSHADLLEKQLIRNFSNKFFKKNLPEVQSFTHPHPWPSAQYVKSKHNNYDGD